MHNAKRDFIDAQRTWARRKRDFIVTKNVSDGAEVSLREPTASLERGGQKKHGLAPFDPAEPSGMQKAQMTCVGGVYVGAKAPTPKAFATGA
jgi:hypothetical protein